MGKKDTKTTSTGNAGIQGTAEGAAAARDAKEAAAGKDKFTYLGEPTKKVAPQAQVIINCIKAADMDGDKLRAESKRQGITRTDLVAALSANDGSGKPVLTTRQPPGRILSYYQKLIQDTGAVRVDKGSAPAEAAK